MEESTSTPKEAHRKQGYPGPWVSLRPASQVISGGDFLPIVTLKGFLPINYIHYKLSEKLMTFGLHTCN